MTPITLRKSILCLVLGACFLMLASGVAFADDSYDIYTTGNGPFLVTTFTAIAAMASSASLVMLVKIALLLGFLFAIFQLVMPSTLGMMQAVATAPILHMIERALIALFVWFVFMIPQTSVTIIDTMDNPSDPTNNQVVGGVPWFTASVSSYACALGNWLTQEVDEWFIDTGDTSPVTYQNGGLALGATYFSQLLSIAAPGPSYQYDESGGYVPINAVLAEYFNRCVFPGFQTLIGNNDLSAQVEYNLLNNTNLLGYFNTLSGTSGGGWTYNNGTISLNNSFGDGSSAPVDTCNNAISDIVQYWSTISDYWILQYNQEIFAANTAFGYVLQNGGDLGTTQQIIKRYMPNTSASVESVVEQIAVINTIRQEAMFLTNQNTGLQGANGLAGQQAGGSWIQTAQLFGRTANMMHGVAEALVYWSTVFLPVLIAALGFGPLITFVKGVMWLQLWAPMFALLSAYADQQLLTAFSNILYDPGTNSTLADVNYVTIEALRTQCNTILGWVGALAATVPVISWGLLEAGKGMAGAVAASLGSAQQHGTKSASQMGSSAAHGETVATDPSRNSLAMADSFASQQQGHINALASLENISQYGTGMLKDIAKLPTATAVGEIEGAGGLDKAAQAKALSTESTAAQIKEVGKGNLISTAVTEAEQRKANAAAFEKTAAAYGGVEQLAKVFATGDLAQREGALRAYQGMSGISDPMQAAASLGGALGSTQAVAGIVSDQLNQTIGTKGRAFTGINEGLNEAAKFEQTYQFAKEAGYAKDRSDFQGMYQGHLAHHATETWMLDKLRADWLNSQMKAQGEKTRFTAGESVTMGRTQDGRITLAKAQGGAESDVLDLTNIQKGTQAQVGTFGRSGSDTWDGTRHVHENTPYQLKGNYQASDGKTYNGQFNFSGDPQKGGFIVSGDGTNVQSYTQAEQKSTPSGFAYSAVNNSSYDQQGHPLLSKSEGGDNTNFSNQLNFSGGYKYDNVISGYLQQHGYDRAAEATGKVKGLITDILGYANLGKLFGSSNSKGTVGGDPIPGHKGPGFQLPGQMKNSADTKPPLSTPPLDIPPIIR